MSAITDIRCVLTQKALDALWGKFHIQEEVHSVLPNQNDTMQERPARKIRMYTRKITSSGWMTLLALFFSWHTAKHVTRDPDPIAVDFNAQDYATLVAHPSLFRKFPKAFLCLVGLSRHYTLDEETYPWFLHKNGKEMDIFVFIQTLDPTKVKGEDANIQPVVEAADTVVEVVSPVQPRRQGKRKSVVVDASGASHPPKKLKEDHGTPSGTFVGCKSRSAIKRLLAGAMLNAKVRVTAIPTLPFVTAFVSSTLKREDGDSSHYFGPTIAEAEVDSLFRSSAPIMTTATTINSTDDSVLVAKEKHVKRTLFSADSSLASGPDPKIGVFSDLTGSDFLVGVIRTFIDPDTDFQKVYVPQWSVTNRSCLDDGRVCREMVDEFYNTPIFYI
uniref:Uncharacterized protein n=1 Tax=Tanacetum cinerariifolium TaxID=118510 RepID=A0A699IH58_TANCI|nr:hypothetical protein [Tanacetum cinerariifolium]